MKKLLLLLLLVTSLYGFSDGIVNIWADNDSDNMGVSKDRVWLKSYMLSNFEYYSTLKTESTDGVLTPITVSRELYFLLDELLQFQNIFIKDSVTIEKIDNVYNFTDTSLGMEISFSLEKPTKVVFDVIKSVYENDAKTEKIVIDHYLDSWIIRIHSAENVVSPDINTLDFDDILITATIIGEKSQWLWGLHDGVDYIYSMIN